MQFEDVETFLTVVECGNIVKASEKLFISQGNCSTRIMNLEKELGIKLLFRQPGVRKITLTPQGENFLHIAKEWMSLERQAKNLTNLDSYNELRIAASDVINTYLLNKVYAYYFKMHKETTLYLQTEHSTEAHQLIEQQQVDIAFVATLHSFPNVMHTPLFSEEMVILCHDDNPFVKSHNLKDLDTDKEIYGKWSAEYEMWHDRLFPNSHKKVTIGNMSMIAEFIIYPETWAIVTSTVADYFCLHNRRLTFVEFTENRPPLRTAYLLYYRYQKPWITKVVSDFMKETLLVLQSFPGIKLLYEPDKLFSTKQNN